MNKMILSLMIILIALTGIASVSASSDFNDTIVLDDDSDIYVNDFDGDIDEIIEMDVPDDQNAAIDSMDNESEDVENETLIESTTNKNDSNPVSDVAKNQSTGKLKPAIDVKIPDVNLIQE